MLTTDHVIDNPSWAPNSRALVFSAQQKYFGPFSLYLVDLTGRALRKIITSCQDIAHEGTPTGANIPENKKRGAF